MCVDLQNYYVKIEYHSVCVTRLGSHKASAHCSVTVRTYSKVSMVVRDGLLDWLQRPTPPCTAAWWRVVCREFGFCRSILLGPLRSWQLTPATAPLHLKTAYSPASSEHDLLAVTPGGQSSTKIMSMRTTCTVESSKQRIYMWPLFSNLDALLVTSLSRRA